MCQLYTNLKIINKRKDGQILLIPPGLQADILTLSSVPKVSLIIDSTHLSIYSFIQQIFLSNNYMPNTHSNEKTDILIALYGDGW